MKRTCWFCLSIAAALLLPTAAEAKHATPDKAPRLDFEARRAPDGFVKIDGFVSDWEGVPIVETRALTRGEPEYDWTGPKDLSLKVQLQYDSTYLYMAVEVRDNIVSPARRRDRGDRVEVWFDSGAGGGGKGGRLRMLELGLGELPTDGKPKITWQFPRSKKNQTPKKLKKDGTLRNTGYFFELAVPLAEISDPAPGLEPIGIGFIVRDFDRDDPNEDMASVATSAFDALKTRNPAVLGRLSLGGADKLIDSFYRHLPETRSAKALRTVWANVGGDSRRERVFLVQNYLVMVGMGLGDGDFYYYTMSASPHYDFQRMETRDLTGDGVHEMLVWYTIRQPRQIEQTMLVIYHFDLDRIKVIFHHEIANKGPGWSIKNEIVFKAQGFAKPHRIVAVAPETAKGVTSESYDDIDSDMIVDWERILLPWEARKMNIFEWEAGQFLKTGGETSSSTVQPPH